MEQIDGRKYLGQFVRCLIGEEEALKPTKQDVVHAWRTTKRVQTIAAWGVGSARKDAVVVRYNNGTEAVYGEECFSLYFVSVDRGITIEGV